MTALALLVLVGVREFQSYVVNPHVMGHSVGLSPLVTFVSVSVVSIVFGGFAVVLAVPFTSTVATLIDGSSSITTLQPKHRLQVSRRQ